jgi:hypothetical protein
VTRRRGTEEAAGFLHFLVVKEVSSASRLVERGSSSVQAVGYPSKTGKPETLVQGFVLLL